ncbi:MAG: hypothetical protein KC493_16385 [Bacteriovoracaceae bacterium]|nr:hypothetical protein [Bacteriovoracaceae bacterium]
MNPKFIEGYKFPNDQSEGTSAIKTKALLPTENSFKGGHNKLLKSVLPSIYQDNAGSCLFMSHTSAIEVLYSENFKRNYDFSERFFMNLSKADIGGDRISNWRTDTVYRLNEAKKIQTNTEYPFVKGWYKTVNGKRVKAREGENGAFYGVKYNWVIDNQQLNRPGVKLPTLEREVLFKDKDENQWNVGQAPSDIVKRVKEAFQKRNAPIIVIYNHTGFWHAVTVVGYNDNASSASCPFVSSYKEKMDKRAEEIRVEASEQVDPKAKRKLLRKARKFNLRGQQVHDSYLDNGGCKGKGVFYVRDSIYPNKEMALYDYDINKEGEEENLNAPIILREYEWLEQVANHAYQIYFE